MSPEIAQQLSGGFAAMQNDLEQRLHEMKKQMEDSMPADIREIQQRMQSGTTTQAEQKRHSEWVQSQSQHFMSMANEFMSGMMPSIGRSTVPESDLRDHVEKLDPNRPPEAASNRVQEVLGKHAVFAEEVLREFLTLLGVRPLFADLSYRYLDECTETDLLEADIKLVAHLKFKSNSNAS